MTLEPVRTGSTTAMPRPPTRLPWRTLATLPKSGSVANPGYLKKWSRNPPKWRKCLMNMALRNGLRDHQTQPQVITQPHFWAGRVW